MTVTLRSPALGKSVGDTHTGPEEDWLVAEGYAAKASPTGTEPGISNTGPAGVVPAKDPSLAENREAPNDPTKVDGKFEDNVLVTSGDAQPYDFDPGHVDNDPPTIFDPDPDDVDTADLGIEPNTGPAAGGTVVTITGRNLKDVTAVTFGGVAGTSLVKDSDESIHVTAPAHATGAVNVSVTDPSGTTTVSSGYTYA